MLTRLQPPAAVKKMALISFSNIEDAPPLPAELLEIITDNTSTCAAPENVTRQSQNNIWTGDDKELLKPRLREYITARGIAITKKGGTEWIKCPLHDDNSPSMQINTSGKYMFILKCHACGATLNIFGLARVTTGLPEGKKYFPQVVDEIKTALGIGL